VKPKPTTGTFVVSLSDMHSGSSVALFPDRFVQFGKDGPNHTPSDNQRRMHDHWIKCAEYVRDNRKGKKLIIVHNGDAIEGIHHNSLQVVSPSWDDHVDIHVELMNEFLKVAGFAKNKGDLLYYVSGTESHTANKEERIANEMNAEHYDDELRLRVNGRDLWYTHHGSGGSPVIQMEVEEVNQSPNVPTKRPLNTKEPSSRNMTSATSPAMAVAAVCRHDWYKITHGGWRCWYCQEESTDPT